jgi:hypothetical protein
VLQINGMPKSNLVRNGGGLAALFSLALVLIILFALPAACSVVFSFQLVIFALIFVLGVLAFMVGQSMMWFKRRK